jgi:hypothetical protein
MLYFRVLFADQIDHGVKPGCATFPGIMNKFEKPRYKGQFFCEIPRCARNQYSKRDQPPSIVLLMNFIKSFPSPPKNNF